MNINLLPWRETLRKKLKKRLYIETVFFLLLSCLSIFILCAINQSVLASQRKEIRSLESEINTSSETYEKVLVLKKQDESIKQKEDFLKQKSKENKSLVQLLEQVSEQITDSMYFTQVDAKKDALHFLGYVGSHAELAKFLEEIKKTLGKNPSTTEIKKPEEGRGDVGFDVGYVSH